MKTISIFLSLINSLMAGLLIAISLSHVELQQAEILWSIIRIGAAFVVIAFGVITWITSARDTNSGILPLGGIFLLLLGTSTILWTFHIAILSGDMEFYMIGYGGSLMVQGLASLLGFAGESRNVTA